MSKTRKAIEQLRVFLPMCGFKEDQWGHFQKDTKTKPHPETGEVIDLTLRIKMGSISVRVETKSVAYPQWVMRDGVYFRDITYAEDGSSVKIGRYTFKQVK